MMLIVRRRGFLESKRQQFFPGLGSTRHTSKYVGWAGYSQQTLCLSVGAMHTADLYPQAGSTEPSLVLCLLLPTEGSSSGSGAMPGR